MAYKKGIQFERDCAKELGLGKYGKRVPLSGSIKDVAQLAGDFYLTFPWLDRAIIGEAKHGYTRAEKSMTLQRDWFEKVAGLAQVHRTYHCVAFKFKNTNMKYVAFSFEDFQRIMKEMENMYTELEELRDEINNSEEN